MKMKTKELEPNYALLRKIRDHILEEPKRVHMGRWIIRRTPNSPRWEVAKFPKCGTIACIAGWAMALTGKMSDAFHYNGMMKLRLTEQQANALFYVDDWPLEFAELLDVQAAGTEDYAKVVAARIDKFIESKGTI